MPSCSPPALPSHALYAFLLFAQIKTCRWARRVIIWLKGATMSGFPALMHCVRPFLFHFSLKGRKSPILWSAGFLSVSSKASLARRWSTTHSLRGSPCRMHNHVQLTWHIIVSSEAEGTFIQPRNTSRFRQTCLKLVVPDASLSEGRGSSAPGSSWEMTHQATHQ